MEYAKLRVSWGKNGNRSIGEYAALMQLSPRKYFYYDPNTGELIPINTFYCYNMANAGLKWENTESWNLGLDFTVLGGRLGGSIDLYNKKTNDLLNNRQLPSLIGYSSVTSNIGEINNKGIELSLHSTNINKPNLTWRTTLNLSYNKNTIKHLYGIMEDIKDDEGNVIGQKEADDITNGYFIGHALDEIWGYKFIGVWQENEAEEAAKYKQQPGDPKLLDVDNNYKFNNDDKVFQGNTTPKVRWNMRNEFTLFKNWNVSFSMYSYLGHKKTMSRFTNSNALLNITNSIVREYWTPDNPINDYPRLKATSPGGVSYNIYQNASFLRFDNISVGYTFPKTMILFVKREVILKQLKEDLENSAAYLSNSVYVGQVSQAAAYHLLAKINLALGDFDAAIEAANKVINDGVHYLMTDRFGVDKNDPTKNVIWDLHQSENKHLPENKEVLYIVLDDYAQTDARSAAGLEIKRQILPWFTASGKVSTPDGKSAFVDNNETKNPYLLEYGRGVCSLRQTWYATHMIWTLDDTDLRHAPGNWMKMTDLKYNNPALKGTSEWYGKPLQMYNDKGECLIADTIRCWVDWPHYKTNVADQKANWWRGGWADWYVFRLAETYLLRAEAYVWKGEKNLAAADINKVRERAGARPITASEVSISQVLDERARELFYEEPRKCELTRIAYIYAKTGIPADNGKTYSLDKFSTENYFYDRIMSLTEFYNKGVKNAYGLTYTMQPYHVLWPIALKATSTNVEGHINQTPGYDGWENNIEPMDRPND